MASQANHTGAQRRPRLKMATDTSPTAPDALTAIYGAMSEAELQRSIRTYLMQRGFTVWVFPIMKRTIAGVPDLTFWHAERPGLLWYWELKRERGRVRPEQVAAIAHLATVPGIDARIVRPSGWAALRDVLDNADGPHLIDMLTAIPRGL